MNIDDFVFTALIARHPDPASASRALAIAEATVLHNAASVVRVDRDVAIRIEGAAFARGMTRAIEILRGLADSINAPERTEGKSSRQADATPGLNDRQTRLLDAIRRWRGEWTTARVLHLYALTDPTVVKRGTARGDLTALHRAGHLVLVDDPDNRHYVLRQKDGRS